MRRDPAKAIVVLDAMLEFFNSGERWTRGAFLNGAGQRCLIGALRYVRWQQHIRGAGVENYLRGALIERIAEDIDGWPHPASTLWRCDGGDTVLMCYNDTSAAGYDEVRALIVEARALAEAELYAPGDRR